jgi:hypothetical protein
MECPGCGGGNIEDLPLFWKQQHEGSALWRQYGPPSVPESRVWAVLGVIVAAIAVLVSGAVILGLLLAVGGLVWGAFDRQAVEAARRRLSEWSASKICLACPRVFQP